MSHKKKIVDQYAIAFSQLTPENARELYDLVAEDVLFTDPFNYITGKEGFIHVFDHMFDTCTAPKFTITDIAHSRSSGYLRWRMSGRLKNWPHTRLDFEGMTEVTVNDDGKINRHLDHWDSASQLLQHLPLIGVFMRPVLRLFRLKPKS